MILIIYIWYWIAPYTIFKVYAICVDEPPFLLVTEFLENGDLKNYLKKEEAKIKLTFDKLIRISENVSWQNAKSETFANLMCARVKECT